MFFSLIFLLLAGGSDSGKVDKYSASEEIRLSEQRKKLHFQIKDVMLQSHSVLADTLHVLWDTLHGSHHGGTDYTPWVYYSKLVALLDSNAYQIEATNLTLDQVNLSQYDVIVIGASNAWDFAYSASEVDSLQQYIEQSGCRVLLTGDCNVCSDNYLYDADNRNFILNVFSWLADTGGILIMGENIGCPNPNIQPVASAFNMTVGISDYAGDLYFSNFTPHPVFSGISQLYFRAGGEISAGPPSEEIAWNNANTKATVACYECETANIFEPREEIKISLEVAPNPFYDFVRVKGFLGEILVYDYSGRLVAKIRNSLWDGKDIYGEEVSPGIYFLISGDIEPTKVIKLK